jgi:hypothetical protein
MLSFSPSQHLIVVDVDVAISRQQQEIFLDVLERGM